MTRDEANAILGDVRARIAKRDACTGHVFVPANDPRRPWQQKCERCGWEPEASARAAYLQGLEHGRRAP